MEEPELMNLWKSYDKKLEESLSLNRKNAEEITKMKVQSFVGSMKPWKIVTLLIGVGWVGLGSVIVTDLFLFAYAEVSKFFLFSASIQLLLTAIAIGVYVYQLVLIQQVDSNEPVVKTQEHLAHLKSSTLWVTRVLFLQLPVWTTFYLSESMFKNGNIFFLLIQGVVTFSFAYVAFWLFFHIKPKNQDRKWFRLIFDGQEWTPVLKSIALLHQIEDYKTES